MYVCLKPMLLIVFEPVLLKEPKRIGLLIHVSIHLLHVQRNSCFVTQQKTARLSISPRYVTLVVLLAAPFKS